MSTDSEKKDDQFSDWISQAEAARLRGTTRQAIAKLVKKGRIRTMTVGGYVLVSRTAISEYKPQPAGRRKTKRSQ